MNLSSINQLLFKECRLQPGNLIVVGVSGGPDSLCLLDILVKSGHFPIIAAHFDHHLRIDSSSDAQKVAEIAKSYEIDFCLGEEDVKGMAQTNHFSIEEAARVCRYKFLFDTARTHHAQAVVVAHTADDQVETFLMHLLRGTGTHGLKGMSFYSIMPDWDKEIPLVRPLLGQWREDILNYCQISGLKPLMDPTNQNREWIRNRIRHELIPTLETYNPRVRRALRQTAEIIAADATMIDQIVDDAWQECLIKQEESSVVWSRLALIRLPVPLQRNLWRRAFHYLRPNKAELGFREIEQVIDFCANPTRSNEKNLAGGLRLALVQNHLYIYVTGSQINDENWIQMGKVGCQILERNGSIFLESGWMLHSEELEDKELPDETIRHNEKFHAILDSKSLSFPLLVRTQKPGDRFRPLGMKGQNVRLSDFWAAQHIPKQARSQWPLVLSEGEIVWIPGIRIADTFKVTSATEKFTRLEIKKKEIG